MAAPTKPAYVKKALANLEPSTHGTFETSTDVRFSAAVRCKADISVDCRTITIYEYTP